MKSAMQAILMILFLIPITVAAQVLDYINVRLTIQEKVGHTTEPLANAKLNISDLGEVATDDAGEKFFTYPIQNTVDPKISISLLSNEHKTLKPLDANIAIDTTRDEMVIEMLVVNMANENETFRQRIVDLERRMEVLKKKNQLTEQQLAAISQQLIDTIFYYEGIKQEMMAKIENLENVTEEQQSIIEAQNQRILELENQVYDLTDKLTQALEEKYLRQKEYFDKVTRALRSYVRKAQDLKNHLPFIESYFISPTGLENYSNDINAYNAIYEEIDNERANYLEGVENYWDNKGVSRNLEEVFDLALKGIHLDQMLPTLTGIYGEFTKQRPKKAKKIAEEHYETMSMNLNGLEQKINRIEMKMRNDL